LLCFSRCSKYLQTTKNLIELKQGNKGTNKHSSPKIRYLVGPFYLSSFQKKTLFVWNGRNIQRISLAQCFGTLLSITNDKKLWRQNTKLAIVSKVFIFYSVISILIQKKCLLFYVIPVTPLFVWRIFNRMINILNNWSND